MPKFKRFFGPSPCLAREKKKKAGKGKFGSSEIETENQVVASTETEIKYKDSSFQRFIMQYDRKERLVRMELSKIRKLRKAVMNGSWWEVESIIKKDKNVITQAIDSDGNTMLHMAVRIGQNYLVEKLLMQIDEEKLPQMKNVYGSTTLHIAASVGNTIAAMYLMRKNKTMSEIVDRKGEKPLQKAYDNTHLNTINFLLVNNREPGEKIGVDFLRNAISAKKYYLAVELVFQYPELAKDDSILMDLILSFPSEPDYGESLVYPNMEDMVERIVKRATDSFRISIDLYERISHCVDTRRRTEIIGKIIGPTIFILGAPLVLLCWIYTLIRLLILVVYFPFFMLYFLLWKVAARVVPPIKRIEKRKNERDGAKKLLKLVCLVCDEIDTRESLDTNLHHYYTRPLLEAARQDLYEVVDEILMRAPGAIQYRDESGYDIIQLALINRSERTYNLIHNNEERKSFYRTIQDSFNNNMLHLVGRLPPSHKLRLKTGPALQLQRELQWRQEVEKLVLPRCITQKNISMETPDMVFRREHENLVKDGEKWMKAVAESCSITAALITTIMFAAAITVPGGYDQNTGIPLFTKEIAFTIFAVSDAISLFSSSTSLLMFLSILTGSFDEQDFVVNLPRRLMIGLCTLMLSTTSMMVAFAATLFLVFCHKRPWMLVPVCVLSFVPIASFGILQIPLIVDLYRSTYRQIFGKTSSIK